MDNLDGVIERLLDHADAWDSGHTMSAASDDLREAAAALETLTQENARLREALEAMLLYADPNGEGVYDGANDIVGVKQSGEMVLKGSFITTCIRARKALGGGDE